MYRIIHISGRFNTNKYDFIIKVLNTIVNEFFVYLHVFRIFTCLPSHNQLSHFEHVAKNLSYQIRNVKTVQILRLLSAFLSLWSFRS